MELISKFKLLERIDKEREYLRARGLFGAEHILVHNFRELVEEASPEAEYLDMLTAEHEHLGFERGFNGSK